jgi:IMP dehydrogenase
VKAAHTVYDTPVTVTPSATVGEAMSLIPKRAHGAVVVVEDGKVLGIVTERDGAEIDRFAQVREVMTTDVLTFDAGTDPQTCFNEMSARHIDFSPVLDGGQLVGVLTRKGALRSTSRRSTPLELS